MIVKGKCSNCGKDVIVWGDVVKCLCIKCDEEERNYMTAITTDVEEI